jgi:hypothetical protein
MLWPQIEVMSCDARAAARQVQFESVEAQESGNSLIHGAPCMNRYRYQEFSRKIGVPSAFCQDFHAHVA